MSNRDNSNFLPHWFKYIHKPKNLDINKKTVFKKGYKSYIKKSTNHSKIRVAFFLDGVFYPTTTGESYHIMNLLKALTKNKIDAYLFRCYRGWEKIHIYKTFPFSSVCINPDVYYNNLQKISEIVNIYEINVIVFDTAEVVLRQGKYLKDKCKVKIVYDVTNVDPLISEKVGLGQSTISLQTRELLEADKHIDIYWVKTREDKRQLSKLGTNPRKIRIRGVGINIPSRSKIKKKQLKQPVKSVFLGNMFYPPNIGGLTTLTDTLTKCTKRGIRLKIDVIGDGDIVSLSAKYPLLNFLGRCDYVNSTLSKYDIAFACPSFGSGISLKVLDYMAAGLPIIANNTGVRGHLRSINKCLLQEENDSLYKCVEQLVTNKDLFKRLSVKEFNYLKKYYDIKNKIPGFIMDLKKLV
ncbi:MAG: hypothetical protein ACD_22C00220G0004 [uncultured bacterium]|nr:MAG: hypothetical protein ACD_22C00220G0004 [uncultured bacterium]